MPEDHNIHILKPGLQCLVQDLGRNGWQQFGIPQGGAMDQVSHRMANWLVGNNQKTPTLEMTLIGPEILVDDLCVIAVTGADLNARVNNERIPMNRAINCEAGSVISFGKSSEGCRGYLAIRGLWELDKWLDSYSVLSGYADLLPSSQLAKGSSLKVISKPCPNERVVPQEAMSKWDLTQPIRVLPGPEFKHFSDSILSAFFSEVHRISPDANRMGYRLQHCIDSYEQEEELISSGIVPGVIQITRSGQPIVMMVDGQTSGGYYRMANVISADLPRLAQYRPGDEISFEMVTLDTALQAMQVMNSTISFLAS